MSLSARTNRFAGLLILASTAAVSAACASDGGSDATSEPQVGIVVPKNVPDIEPQAAPESNIGQVTQSLKPTDTVGAAVAAEGCDTSVVKALSVQIIQEIDCLRPATFSKIDKIPNVSLSASVAALPYIQTPALGPLTAAAKTRNTPMSINSALRSLAQQYLLYSWWKRPGNPCGYQVVAVPGTSNHESGLAVDINDSAGWRTALSNRGFRWLGAGDVPHYDYIDGGVKLSGLSVKAFQRLWNRNNPQDKIDEDGVYGDNTGARLAKTPIGGFSIGARCDVAVPKDAGPDSAPLPDGATPPPPVEEPPPADLPMQPDTREPTAAAAAGGDSSSCGCKVGATNESAVGVGLIVAALLGLASRRRRQAA
jgi:D-alanyl-D-alanine carboxypeptidase